MWLLPVARELPMRARLRADLYGIFFAPALRWLSLWNLPITRGAPRFRSTGASTWTRLWLKAKGVIVLSAHLGNFFLVGTRLAVEGHHIHVLINQPGNSQFAKLLDDYRLQIRLSTIHARPRRQALQEISAVLRRNEIAVMITDEYRRGNGIPTTFFGRTVLARRGPATLASRTGAAVVPACLVRQPDDTLRLVIEPELELARSGNGKAEIAENILRMTQWLEKTVRAYPDQWNWMNIRWSGDNEGQRSEVGDQKSEIRSRFC